MNISVVKEKKADLKIIKPTGKGRQYVNLIS